MTDMQRRLEAFESFDGCKREAGEEVVKFLARWEASWSKCKQTGTKQRQQIKDNKLKDKRQKTKDENKDKKLKKNTDQEQDKDILVKMQASLHPTKIHQCATHTVTNYPTSSDKPSTSPRSTSFSICVGF